jgi:hypothetical protein
MAVSPGTGTGSNQTFEFTYSDSSGAADLASVGIFFMAPFGSMANSCSVYYQPSMNRIWLYNDSATFSSQRTLGTSGTLGNSQCTIALSNSFSTANGNDLLVTLTVSFSAAFRGTKEVNMNAFSTRGTIAYTGPAGSWTVP